MDGTWTVNESWTLFITSLRLRAGVPLRNLYLWFVYLNHLFNILNDTRFPISVLDPVPLKTPSYTSSDPVSPSNSVELPPRLTRAPFPLLLVTSVSLSLKPHRLLSSVRPHRGIGFSPSCHVLQTRLVIVLIPEYSSTFLRSQTEKFYSCYLSSFFPHKTPPTGFTSVP